MLQPDREAKILAGAVVGLLGLSTLIARLLQARARTESGRRTVQNLIDRINAWWVMVLVFGAAIYFGLIGAGVLFGLVSFFALREMITLSPTRRGDHHTLFWAFFIMTPLQYYFVVSKWYGMASIFIPVYCFLFLAIRSAMSGDATRYMERTAKVQWGVMICVYCVSHAPLLLTLQVAGMEPHETWKLLVWLVITVQMSDVLQYVWGKSLGRHKIAPSISPSKTWEGFVGGVLSAIGVGVLLRFLTPFDIYAAMAIGLAVVLLGFFAGLVMSAIKRDAGVKDYGNLIGGHGGMMDRIDSITFAAPVFFHLVRYYYPTPIPA